MRVTSMRIAGALLAFMANAAAHIVITYPGTRGHNLVTNDTFPYGMQFEYPCMLYETSRSFKRLTKLQVAG